MPFCSDVLGLKLVARATIAEQPMAFFSIAGNHHDLALVETSPEAPAAPEAAPGLAHLALKIGDSLHDLRAAQIWLEERASASSGRSTTELLSLCISWIPTATGSSFTSMGIRASGGRIPAL